MKTATMKPRPLSLAQARSAFAHRFTMEHVPQWAREVRSDGTYYAPQFRSDAEWYANTLFHGESDLATRNACYTSGQTWPLGKSLPTPYAR